MLHKLQTIKNKYKKGKSKSLKAQKAFAIFALFLLPFLWVPVTTFSASLDEEIRQNEEALSDTRVEKRTLNDQIKEFDYQINDIEQSIYQTNQKIQSLNVEINETKKKIVQKEKELEQLKEQLATLIQVMYEEGQISSIEIIAKSSTFSDFVNKTEYIEQIQAKVQLAAETVVKLKNELESKKKELEADKKEVQKLQNVQLTQRNNLSAQKREKQNLLVETKGDEKTYQSRLAKLYAERAALASRGNQTINSGGSGGYPYTGSCGGVDPWSYYKCQCTSFSAWKWNAVYGKRWMNMRYDGYGTGNAWNWPTHAIPQGYSVSYAPRVGAIAVWPQGAFTSPHYYDIYGHVAIVTAVSGNKISVEEYNYVPLSYSRRDNVSINGYNSYTGFSYRIQFIY
ncbi:MAG: CHAP domain-containing protein [Patescibacteria group bacterium]|nr:CHAP domain-containing protein [Patescibacteria group bacterium]